ncbi:MAG: AAA family ATPase [Caldilineaceae bacterium]|nr:AAA family ATPase [Caldilineaceae bacterium]
MRNPYIVGRWLFGKDHYGRQRVLDYLLNVQEPATWVVGTRRMGKTSLLRQLEWMTSQTESPLVPLFWDLQGCETPADLDYELFISVEDQQRRFEALGVNIASLETMDTIRILRTLQRTLRESNKQLFLLIDETEALINVAARDSSVLARLRKLFQSGNQRTVMVATKSLMRLNDLSLGWNTSPFLFGVNLVNLWSLDADASRALVLQQQSDFPLNVDSDLVEDVLIHTHRHPYLIQYLCARLFESTSDTTGTLRPIRDMDLQPDQLLSGFFQIDFDHLTAVERQILLTVARHSVISDEKLYAELANESPARVSTFVYGMNKLGHLRSVYGQWTLGNEFLRRWVLENYDQLIHAVQSQISDQGVESLLVAGRKMEQGYLQQELRVLQTRLDGLLEQRNGYAGEVPLLLSTEIHNLRREISLLGEQLRDLDKLALPLT